MNSRPDDEAPRIVVGMDGSGHSRLGESRPESVTVQVVSGTPAHELLSTARDADMIVVGSRGAGGFARLVMGSVSTQVSHHAHCPVAVIPPVLAWAGNGRPGGGQVT